MDAKYNEKGEEIPDNTPVELPLGYHHPEELQDMIRRMVTDAAVLAAQEAAGVDTEEEADDFNVMGEESDEISGYEFTEMQEEQLVRERQERVRKKATQESVTVPQPSVPAPSSVVAQ